MRIFKFGIVLAIALLFTANVFAAKQDAASTFVESLSKQAIDTLTAKSMNREDRDHQFRALLNKNFDVPTIGRFALGRYWRTATTAQQQEYLALFEKQIVRTYSDRFAKYSGQTLEAINSSKDGDVVLVKSRLNQPDGSEPVLIDWRLKPAGKEFRITDVIVEGVSMSTNQRSEYAAIIERNGGDIEALLKLLRQKYGMVQTNSAEAVTQ